MTSKASPQVPQSPSASANKHGGLPYKVFKQGFLLKQTHRGVIKTLKRYWFVLFQQKDMMAFLYFQDEDHYLERKKNAGFFRIEDATSINVLPEFMGRKHAFNIDTPRNKYVLVSESRYEMNEWLLTLHGAMEEYKTYTLARRKKSRPRTNSNSGASTTGSSASSNKTPPGVPRIKPSRPAPPAPPNKRKSQDGSEYTTPTNENPTHFPTQATPTSPTMPLDTIVANLLQESRNMTELNYSMVEEEEELREYEDDDVTPLGSAQTANSKSLPMLNNGMENGSSSPELDSETGEPIHRHMRLSGSYEFDNERSTTIPLDGHSKKRVRKRSSIKGRRSVSPPNLPPPPPPEEQAPENPLPPTSTTGDESTIPSSHKPVVPPETEEVHSDQWGGQVTNQVVRGQIMGDRSPQNKPKPPPPVRTTSLAQKSPQEVDMELNMYLDEAFNHEDMQQLPSNGDHGNKENEGLSMGILRKRETKPPPGKRNVMFKEDGKSQSYEPRIDQESSIPTSVREAKMKLFGGSVVEETAKYRRNSNEAKRLSGERIKSPADELLESIETALQPTNYMESPSPPPVPDVPPSSGRRAPPKAPEKSVTPVPKETPPTSPPTNPSDDGMREQPDLEHDPNTQTTMYRSVV